MDVFLKHAFLGGVFPRTSFSGISFSEPFLGMCLGCLLDAVCECSRDAFLVFRPQMLISYSLLVQDEYFIFAECELEWKLLGSTNKKSRYRKCQSKQSNLTII